jgi:hypothetical protein
MASLALWGNAVASGVAAPDAMTHAVGATRWHSHEGTTSSLPVALAERRSGAAVRLRLVLPVSGDPGALRAEPGVIAAAVASGAAIVLEPVVPQYDDTSVLLLAAEPSGSTTPRTQDPLGLIDHVLTEPVAAQADVATCARDLARAISEASEALSALDVGSGRSDADDELRRQEALLAEPPPGADPRAQQLLHRSLTVLIAAQLAERAENRAVSATQLRLRSTALADLARAARRGIEAATGPGWAGPPGAAPGR